MSQKSRIETFWEEVGEEHWFLKEQTTVLEGRNQNDRTEQRLPRQNRRINTEWEKMKTQEPGGSVKADALNTASPCVLGSVTPKCQKNLKAFQFSISERFCPIIGLYKSVQSSSLNILHKQYHEVYIRRHEKKFPKRKTNKNFKSKTT